VANRQIQLVQGLKAEARRLGFDYCRVAAAGPTPHASFFAGWLAAGRAGEMDYLTRHSEKRADPRLLAGAGEEPFQSLLVLGVNYHQFDLPTMVLQDPSRGIIARYAWGEDYHELIRPQLYALDAWLRGQSGRTTHGKGLVDTGPVLERDWAQTSGLGFTGKNCCTIHPQDGSWLFLATLAIPEQLPADPIPRRLDGPMITPEELLAGIPPSEQLGSWELPGRSGGRATCGRCTRCMDSCPTDAFVGPFHLDPQRCISYWTIEAKGPVPRTLRSRFGNRIFGCDICQEVCPWNARLAARRPALPGLEAQQARVAPPLLEGFDPAKPYWLEVDLFNAHFRRSPLRRAKRAGMLRNVCIALGNWADPRSLLALQQALQDPEALPRGHAAWALGCIWARHRHPTARKMLLQAQVTEQDCWVREEIAAALDS
jgi:epoxyqueuosine reductase